MDWCGDADLQTELVPEKTYWLAKATNSNFCDRFIDKNHKIAEVVSLPGGCRCNGEQQGGNLSGQVVCNYANGDRYEGNFVEGKKQGHC